jgi:iron complex transport system ATP-binding protein
MESLPPALSCEGLTCGYNSKAVVSGIGFELSAGESVAILGPNGAGKSSLLKTLSGELKPLSGSVSVYSEAVRQELDVHGLTSSDSARLIAMVPQEEPTPFPFSVREIVTMGRLAFGSGIFDSEEDLEAADRALRLAGCEELAKRSVMELSGGEKQRVLIARALAQDAPVMLMDEPTSHLDPAHQVAIASLIGDLARSGKAVLTVVHDLNLASVFASRAILISGGSVVADAPIEEVLEGDALDEAYGTRFERVRTGSGRLLVVGV